MNEHDHALYLFSLDLHTKSYTSEYGCLFIVAANSIAEAQELAATHYIGGRDAARLRDDIDFGECRPIGVPMPGTTPGIVSHFVT
jgi:hypothetical protein